MLSTKCLNIYSVTIKSNVKCKNIFLSVETSNSVEMSLSAVVDSPWAVDYLPLAAFRSRVDLPRKWHRWYFVRRRHCLCYRLWSGIEYSSLQRGNEGM